MRENLTHTRLHTTQEQPTRTHCTPPELPHTRTLSYPVRVGPTPPGRAARTFLLQTITVIVQIES